MKRKRSCLYEALLILFIVLGTIACLLLLDGRF